MDEDCDEAVLEELWGAPLTKKPSKRDLEKGEDDDDEEPSVVEKIASDGEDAYSFRSEGRRPCC